MEFVLLSFVFLGLLCTFLFANSPFGVVAGRVDLAHLLFCVTPIFIYGLYLVGFRSFGAGYDTPVYVYAYGNLNSLWSAQLDGQLSYGNTEYLWWPVQYLIKVFFDTRGWLIANYCLCFLSVFLAYRVLCRQYGLSFWIFPLVFLTYFLIYSGNIIRQTAGLPFAFLALATWYDRKRLISAAWMFLAVGLHWSCLIFILVPILSAYVYRRDFIFWLIPFVALIFSVFAGEFFLYLFNVIGLDQLQEKGDVYLSGNRDSHVGVVWQTLNFWLCVSVSFLFLFICRASLFKYRVLHATVSLVLSLVMFGVNVADLAERYFPALLLLFPVMTAMLIRQLFGVGAFSRLALFSSFFLMGVLVILNDSARYTLGL